VHGNGTVTTYEYDARTFRLARLRLVRDADSAVLQDLRYTYDPSGNVMQIRDGAQQARFFANAVVSGDQRFEYSAAYRLVRATGREHASLGQPVDQDFAFGPQPHPDDPAALREYTQEYQWDAVGNLLRLQHGAAGGSYTRQYAYAAAGNRLLRNSAPGEAAEPFSHSYSYDEHGNMTAMPHLAALAWDHADRLQHADLGGGGDVWFVYDAAGERVRKVQVNVAGSVVRERVYLAGVELYRERAANSATPTLVRESLHVGDDTGRLCLVETLTVRDGVEVASPVSVRRHQYGNHLGSASLELDGDAAVISYEEFHPFGTTSYAANDAGIEVSAKRYRYIGKERDEETGLYHLGARYYASWLGRWTATDPTGLGDGVNRYAYVRGNPISLVDTQGTASTPTPLQLEHARLVAHKIAVDAHLSALDARNAQLAREVAAYRGGIASTRQSVTELRGNLRLAQSYARSRGSADVRRSRTPTLSSMADAIVADFKARPAAYSPGLGPLLEAVGAGVDTADAVSRGQYLEASGHTAAVVANVALAYLDTASGGAASPTAGTILKLYGKGGDSIGRRAAVEAGEHVTGVRSPQSAAENAAGSPGTDATTGGNRVRESDLTGGKHAADRPLSEVISEAGKRVHRPGHPLHARRLPQGRWSSAEAAQAAANRADPALGRQVVELQPGEGTVVHAGVDSYPPNPSAPTYLQVEADRALAIPQADGSIHIFPIDETHYLYGKAGPRP
jgi:RHS repeat-associated protein